MKKLFKTDMQKLRLGKKLMFLTVKGLAMSLSLGLVLIACNDSDPEPEPDPDPNPITSIKIDPKEVSFNEIGQSQEFTANAFDKDGLTINTSFTWSSSDAGVVAISSNGLADAIGPGTASIYVTANEIVDSAQVVVELLEDPSIWWASATDGDWSDASRWSTGAVPSPTDTVAIPLEGDYTVTLTEDVSVSYLLLGAPDGNQKLATGSKTFTMVRGKLIGGAELQVDGTVNITDEVNWVDGDITGSGKIEVARETEMHAGGGESKLILKATLINSGTFAIVSDVTIDINGGTLENKSGALVDFQSDGAYLTAFSGGTINNLGNIIKSEGSGDAWISANSSSNGTFTTSGFIGVERGNLNISGGDLAGVIDVDADAELRQSGNTLIRSSLISNGDGVIEIGGTITLGEQVGDLIRLNNVVFDSWNTTGGISGPGDLRIKSSLLWRKGGITGAGNVFIHGANVRLEGTGSKVLSERIFDVYGTMETESLINLTLANGAQILIDESSEWVHTGGGTIKKSSGDTPGITVLGNFRKKGEGALVVETDFTCAGEMYLEEDVLTVQGSFNLQETGKIIGGGTDANSENLRLIVIEAPSAILAGTIEVDSDGDPATMSILGSVTIESTFIVLIDYVKFGSIPAESLTFQTGGVSLAGTLDVTVRSFPDVGSYQVVSTIDGTGAFDSIIGDDIGVFDSIQEDGRGVLLIRN